MLAMALVILAAATPVAGASCADPIKGEELTLIGRPNPNDMERVYSHRTEQEDGEARLLCSLTAQGKVARCIVEHEDPADGNFGAMALKLAPRFQYATTTRDGRPVAGHCTRITIKWRME